MLAAPPSAFSAPDDDGPGAGARSRWQLRLLDELAEMGMDLARDVHRRVTDQGEAGGDAKAAPPPADPGLAFSRVARTVRLTLALGTRVQEAMDARTAAAARPSTGAASSEAVERLKQLLARKYGGRHDARFEDVFPDDEDDDEDEAEDDVGEAGEREAGLCELRERLVEVERDPDLSGRPVGEVIADVRRDLGVEGDGSGQTAASHAIAPPLGELAAKRTEGDFDSEQASALSRGPLHHAARGPPPPAGEELKPL